MYHAFYIYYSEPHNNPADTHHFPHFLYMKSFSHKFNFLKETEPGSDNVDI